MVMEKDLDAFVRQLQSDIFEQTRTQWGEAAFARWKNPRHIGEMPDADAQARLRGSCGDEMRIFLKFEQERVSHASFLTDGCGPSLVCGSFAAEMAHGKTPEALFDISGETILAAAGPLPPDHVHCAFLAAATLQAAANDYLIRQTRKKTPQGPETDVPIPHSASTR